MKKIYQKPTMQCFKIESTAIIAASPMQTFNLDEAEEFSGDLNVKSESFSIWDKGW